MRDVEGRESRWISRSAWTEFMVRLRAVSMCMKWEQPAPEQSPGIGFHPQIIVIGAC